MEKEDIVKNQDSITYNKSRLPLVCLLLDGWGIEQESVSNIISNSDTSFFDSLLSKYPCTRLKQVDNERDFARADIFQRYKIIGTGMEDFNIKGQLPLLLEKNKLNIEKTLSECIANNHLIIPLEVFLDQESSGYEFVHYLKSKVKGRVILHLITNSFDLKKRTALAKVKELNEYFKPDRQVYIASVHGRNFIMNHDLDWNKTKTSFETMENTQSANRVQITSLEELYVLQNSYDNTLEPVQLQHKIKNYHIAKNDSVIFYNSNNENFQQIIQHIQKNTTKINIITLKEVNSPDENIQMLLLESYEAESLSRILSYHHLNQLKIAPSRTFTALTYSFNNNVESPYSEENWQTFNDKNITVGITNEIINALDAKDYDVIFASIPSIHLLAEHGEFEKLEKEIKEIDKSIKKIVTKVLQNNGTIVLTSPFGNAEAVTIAHDENLKDLKPTDSTVPFIFVNNELEGVCMQNQQLIGTDLSIIKPLGSLKDIVPTILDFLQVEKPNNLQGKNIL